MKNPIDPGGYFAVISVWVRGLGEGLKEEFQEAWEKATPLAPEALRRGDAVDTDGGRETSVELKPEG
jgi:hypothetical protein